MTTRLCFPSPNTIQIRECTSNISCIHNLFGRSQTSTSFAIYFLHRNWISTKKHISTHLLGCSNNFLWRFYIAFLSLFKKNIYKDVLKIQEPLGRPITRDQNPGEGMQTSNLDGVICRGCYICLKFIIATQVAIQNSSKTHRCHGNVL